jgi:phage-related protein
MASGTTLGKAYVQIMPSAEGISGHIREALGGPMSTEGESAGRTFGGKFATVAKAAVVAAAIGKFIKQSIMAGADLEQSVGGVETLFKGSADRVKEYARQSFQTTQLSANDYMETVTSFSASMLQSFGGNTKKAADMSNRAVIDMADNANKMGTDMSDIQNAYQGFAKQNYMMLDNLKLGYGGTKSEMQRLISDASKMTKEQDALNLSVKDGDLSFSNIVSAISVMQKHLGIAGTSAKEAKTTLSGSFNMMKSSAQDFMASLTGVKDSEGNAVLSMQKSLQNMITSAGTFIRNLGPVIANMMVAIPQAIYTVLTKNGPQFTNSAVEMMNNLAKGLPKGIPKLMAQVLPMISKLVANIRQNAGKLVDAGLNLILALAQGLINSLPVLIQYVPQIVIDICGIINDNMPKILLTGGKLILMLIEGIITNIPNLIANSGKIVEAIYSVITAFGWIDLGSNMVKMLSSGMKSLLSLPGNIMNNIVANIKETIDLGANWRFIGRDIIRGIADGIKAFKSEIWQSLKAICEEAIGNVKKFFGIKSPSRLMANEVGKYLPSGIGVGITANTGALNQAIDGMTNQAMVRATNGINAINVNPTVNPVANGGISSITGQLAIMINIMNAILNKDMDVRLNGRTLLEFIQDQATQNIVNYNIVKGM